jgi:hypothetical protein
VEEGGSSKKGSAGDGGALEIHATQSRLNSPSTIYFDSGTINSILDLELTRVNANSFVSLSGTASSWRPLDSTSSEYKFDTAGILMGLARRREVNGNGLSFGLFAGGYYPLEWASEFSNFYQIPRYELGASLAVITAFAFEIFGRYDYFWPLKNEGKITVDSISTTLEPNEYSHFRLESRFSFIDFMVPEVAYGIYSISGAVISGPFSEKNFGKSSAKYLSAGVAFRPLGDLITVKVKSNRLYGSKDDRAVEYATGRRAISELSNSYSLSFTGSL